MATFKPKTRLKGLSLTELKRELQRAVKAYQQARMDANHISYKLTQAHKSDIAPAAFKKLRAEHDQAFQAAATLDAYAARIEERIRELKAKGKQQNPRYLVTGDGRELAILADPNKMQAVRRAKRLYPGFKKYEAALTDKQTYLGRAPKKAEYGAKLPKHKAGKKRKNRTIIKAGKIEHLDVAKVHNGRRRNVLQKDSDHPIEVTRHYRQGPPGYLSPWQRAAALGQNELFDTGISLNKRAAELRARRGNPGSSKQVYKSGLKEATAGQLPKLARIGLRTGHTAAQVTADLKNTGRFSAAQISQALDKARQAEKRSNPKSNEWEKAWDIYVKALASFDKAPRKGPARRLARARLLKAMQRIAQLDPHLYKRVVEPEYRRMNPISRPAASKTRKIYEKFSGKKAKRQTTLTAPAGTPSTVAKLGRLRLIRTTDGRKWAFAGAKAPFLAADHKGKLHVVGGQYRANPTGETCGKIERIEYETSKPHLGQTQPTIYFHDMGEETGERPTLKIDSEGLIKIAGGAYRIEADGIHN